ncbi:MAG: hypothetical protein R3A48_13465 [Polyangiales bacterium]
MRGMLFATVLLLGCPGRRREPEHTTARQSLNLGATAASPEVHINPQGDAGALQIQIGNVNARLPGEDERARQADPEAR